MQKYAGPLTLLLLLTMVLVRLAMLRRKGIRALHFGRIDKKDFLIPPFAALYFYIAFAAGFGWPLPSRQQFFDSAAIEWA